MAICVIPAMAWAENPAPPQPRIKVDLEDLSHQCDTLKPPQSPSLCKRAVGRIATAGARVAEAERANDNVLKASLALDAAEADFKKDFPDLWNRRAALK